MKRHNMNWREIVNAYDMYSQVLDEKVVGHRMGIKHINIKSALDEVRSMLAGAPTSRVRGKMEFVRAVDVIKNRLEGSKSETPTVNDQVETTEERVNRIFEELKSAISDLAVEMVETKNRELVDAAKRSNLVGFITNRFKS